MSRIVAVPDLHRTLRRLWASPGLALAALLAIVPAGIALLLVAALVQGVLLAPLPYPQPAQLYYLSWQDSPAATHVQALEAGQARHLIDGVDGAIRLGSYADPGTQYTLDGQPGELAERVPGMRADEGLLPTLGVTPTLGRGFTAEEAREARKVVLVSQALWQRRFGRPELGGARLRIDGELHEVVGVLPAGFRFYPAVELVTPARPGGIGAGGSNTHVLVRIDPALGTAATQERLAALARALPEERPGRQPGVRLVPLAEYVLGDSASLLLPLVVAVALLVMLACVNVANLLVGRSHSRRGEAAVELALGARPGRLLARIGLEATVIWGLGLGLAAAIAVLLLPLLPGWVPFQVPRLAEVRLDGASLALAAVVGVLAVLVCAGLGMAGARVGQLASALRTQGAGRGAGVGLQPLLVAAQVALSTVLLAGCAWLLGTFLRVAAIDPGFRVDGITTVQLALADGRYRDEAAATARTVALPEALERELAAVPGVRALASSSSLPLERGLNNWVEFGGSAEGASVEVRAVADGYPALLGLSMLAGAGFDGGGTAAAPRSVLVNAGFAAAHLGGAAAAVGRSIELDGHSWRVAGVLADMREASLRAPPLPTVFVPRAQMDPAIQSAVNRWFTTALLVDAPGVALDAAVRAALARIDPGVALVRTATLGEQRSTALAVERFFAWLLVALALAALVLTAIGLYGVLAQLIALRRHELAVRLALGADARGNALLLARQGLRWIGLGLAAGVPLAWASRQLYQAVLDGHGLVADAPYALAAAAGLTLALLLAALPPLARAGRIEAALALRGTP